MKIKLTSSLKTRGYIIILVMILAAASLLILTGILSYTTTTANLNMRSNELSLCQNAAEAATEKVYAKMAYDFNQYGYGYVSNNFVAGIYQALAPNSSDDPYFGQFNFYDPTSPTNAGRVYVGFLTNYAGPMPTQYTNEFATTNSMVYRIVSNVTMPNGYANNVIGTAQEDVLFALVPINTWAIFYNGELEFSDCATMTVTGRTHSNADICTGTSASLTFSAPVTCCSNLWSPSRMGDSWSLNQGTTYQEGSITDVVSLQISIPMSNAYSIIQPQSPSVISPASATGLQMEYYEAQVVLIVSNAVVGVTSATNASVYITLQVANFGGDPASGTLNRTFNLTNQITTAQLQTNQNNSTNISLPFLTFTNSFADQREKQLNMFVTQIDVGAYANWTTTNLWATNFFGPTLGQYPTILYVADERTFATSNRLAVVRLVNAQRLPYNGNLGFTVATKNPLYIVGNYNTTTNTTGVTSTNSSLAIGSTTNGFTVPAALLSDAITVLSSNWNDSLSSGLYTLRLPLNTTLNAAIVTGNVPSTGTSTTTFSGGVQNLTRLLENWTGYTLTYNTSIVCLYSSQMATNQFQVPGTYYEPPTRNWGFDPTFYNPAREPPGIPVSLIPIRFNWQQPPPGSITTGFD
jgi:hypothetical protein